MIQKLVGSRTRWLTSSLLALAAVAGFAASSARADNIVVPNSDWGIRLYNNGVFAPAAPTILPFDGLTHTITGYNGANVDVTESQTDLTGGVFQIEIKLHSATDLFPTGFGDPTTNFAGIYVGSGSTPLQLSHPFIVTSAFLQATGTFNYPAYFEFVSQLANNAPWDGYFPGPGSVGGFYGGEGAGITTMDLTITGAAPSLVPLPPAFAGGLALLGAMGMAKLRGRKA